MVSFSRAWKYLSMVGLSFLLSCYAPKKSSSVAPDSSFFQGPPVSSELSLLGVGEGAGSRKLDSLVSDSLSVSDSLLSPEEEKEFRARREAEKKSLLNKLNNHPKKLSADNNKSIALDSLKNPDKVVPEVVSSDSIKQRVDSFVDSLYKPFTDDSFAKNDSSSRSSINRSSPPLSSGSVSPKVVSSGSDSVSEDYFSVIVPKGSSISAFVRDSLGFSFFSDAYWASLDLILEKNKGRFSSLKDLDLIYPGEKLFLPSKQLVLSYLKEKVDSSLEAVPITSRWSSSSDSLFRASKGSYDSVSSLSQAVLLAYKDLGCEIDFSSSLDTYLFLQSVRESSSLTESFLGKPVEKVVVGDNVLVDLFSVRKNSDFLSRDYLSSYYNHSRFDLNRAVNDLKVVNPLLSFLDAKGSRYVSRFDSLSKALSSADYSFDQLKMLRDVLLESKSKGYLSRYFNPNNSSSPYASRLRDSFNDLLSEIDSKLLSYVVDS